MLGILKSLINYHGDNYFMRYPNTYTDIFVRHIGNCYFISYTSVSRENTSYHPPTIINKSQLIELNCFNVV